MIYVTGLAYDKYDFEAMLGKKFKDVSQNVKDLNNKAYALQTLNKIKNYYTIIPIKIKL